MDACDSESRASTVTPCGSNCLETTSSTVASAWVRASPSACRRNFSSSRISGLTPSNSASTCCPANKPTGSVSHGTSDINHSKHLQLNRTGGQPGACSPHAVRGQRTETVEGHRGVARRVGARAEQVDVVTGSQVEREVVADALVEN